MYLRPGFADALEHKGVGHLKRGTDVFAHHFDVRLEDCHCAPCKATGLVNRHVGQLWMPLPVLFQNQQQLLGTAERDDWQQTAPATLDYGGNLRSEALLTVLSRQVAVDTIRCLHND